MSIPTDPAGDEENDTRRRLLSQGAPKEPTVVTEYILAAVLGFIGAPISLILPYALVTLFKVGHLPTLIAIFLITPVASVLMLFWRGTRFFGLGAILFFGIAISLLISICGQTSGL